MIVLLRETDYFGVAPAYTLMIYPDGGVAFIGTKNVKVTGLAKGKIGAQDVEQLLDEARKIKFHSFLDEYGAGKGCPFYLADAGSAYVSILIDGKRKSVNHDLGCSEPGAASVFPRELHALELLIDRVANSSQWVK